jgi:hypothetical protein
MVRFASWPSLVVVLALLCFCAQPPAFAQAPQPDPSRLNQGMVSGNVYQNTDLGFRYEFPAGWVVNDPDRVVEPEHQFGWQEDKKGKSQPVSSCFRTLLFVTKYPEGMQTQGFNSMASLTVVDPKCASDLTFPSSVNDHDGIQRVAQQVIGHFMAPTLFSKTPAQVRAFDNGGRVMMEISRALTLSVRTPGRHTIQNVRCAMLVMQANRYWVIWTFVSGDDKEFEQMRASKIYFDQPSAAPISN